MKRKPKLKLYVWEGVYMDWTSGLAFALASSPEHARELILKKNPRDSECQTQEPVLVSKPEAFYVYGGS